MKDNSPKTSEELAAEVQRMTAKLKWNTSGWRRLLGYNMLFVAQTMYPVAQLALAQQREIE